MNLHKIKFLKGVKDFQVVEEGYSGAQKFTFEKNNKKYFLKIGKFRVRDDLEELLTWAKIQHPKVVDSGVFDENNSYIIEEFSEGISLKKRFDELDSKFIYEYGFRVGQSFRNLSKTFPNKKVSNSDFLKFMKEVDLKVENLKESIENNKSILSESQINFLEFLLNFLNKNRKLFKRSVMVFGHTDIKLSNFLINGDEIYATDFEDIGYKEASLSIIWSIGRADFMDGKHYAFANGYLDGLFNFNIPKSVLKCCNYTYLFNICKKLYLYFNKGELDKIEKVISYIKSNHMKNGVLTVDKDVCQVANVHDFKGLKDFKFYYMKGSYSPDNLTFKCVGKDKNYFLKIMKANNKHIKHCLKNYNLMNSVGIPVSPVRQYGKCSGLDRIYVLYDFIEYPEMYNASDSFSFEDGLKMGHLAGMHLKKLKGCNLDGLKIFDKDKLYQRLMRDCEFVFENDETRKLVDYSKKQIVGFINKYIKSFDKEKIDLIHGDVKFGNILYDGNENIIFVDNESLMYSFDIVNFFYNILSAFRGSKPILYQGFVTGYLKFMNNGEIPKRIEGQIKLLLLSRYLSSIIGIKNKASSERNLQKVRTICEKYLKNNEDIEWLK